MKTSRRSELPEFPTLSPALSATAIFMVAFLVYADSLGGKFLFDDTVIIQGNKTIQSLDAAHIHEIFGGHYWKTVESQGGLYRPVVMLSYALNYALGEENPEGYHLLNLLLHAANGILVFLLLEEMFSRRALSFLSALLFVLHPVRTEGVASVVGRAESLCAFFLLVAWWAYVRGRKERAWPWVALSVVSLVMATFTKESAFAFLFLLPLSDFVSGKGKLRERFPFLRTVVFYAPYFAGVIFSLGLRYAVLGGLTPLYINPKSNPLVGVDVWQRFLTATFVFAKYLWLLIFPFHLSADYSYNQIPIVTSILSWRAWLSLYMLGIFLAGIFVSARRAHFLFFCGGIFFPTFLLTSNWIRPIGTIMAERLLYFPSLGFTCAVAYLVCEGLKKPRWRSAASAGAVVLLVGYALKTIDRNLDWKDHYSLFSSAVRTSPNSYLVQGNYATILLHEKNDVRGAIAHARKATEILPDDPAAQLTLGEACRRAGDLAQAAEAFSAVVRMAPRTSGGLSALRSLAEIYESLGRNAQALEGYKRILDWRPSDFEAHMSLGRLYARMDQRQEAKETLLRAKSLAPENPAVEKALLQLDRQ